MTSKTNTTSRTATVAADANPLGHYSAALKAWPVKYAGPKPTADNFKAAHTLGARPGTKTAMAVAMYLRSDGATQAQIINVNGGAYLNKMRAAIEAGQATRVPMSATPQGHTVYKLALGKAKPAKPAKPAKAASKAKPAKPAKVETAKPAEAPATA